MYEIGSPLDFVSKLIGEPIAAIINAFDCNANDFSDTNYIFFKMVWMSIIPVKYLRLT